MQLALGLFIKKDTCQYERGRNIVRIVCVLRAGGPEDAEMNAAPLDTCMWTTFTKWINADTEALLHLLEVSDEFPKGQINGLFDKEIDRLLQQVQQPEVRQQLQKAKGFDWTAYIARSVRNGGIPHHDVESTVHDIVVKMIVTGSLFRGWQGQPILARFKVSVRNAVLNRLEKHNRRRRWFPNVSPEDVEFAMHAAPGDEELIEKFRAEIARHLSPLALAVFDVRLDGGEVKSLVGSPDVASPTAYQIKKEVQSIKQLAQQFGDADFQARVQRLMDAEQETLARRFAARATVPS